MNVGRTISLGCTVFCVVAFLFQTMPVFAAESNSTAESFVVNDDGSITEISFFSTFKSILFTILFYLPIMAISFGGAYYFARWVGLIKKRPDPDLSPRHRF